MKPPARQQSNPKKNADPIKGAGIEFKICFVSLHDKRQVDGIELITDLLQKKKISVDHFEYKVVKKTETRRPINPKLPDGPKEKVVVEEKINVNANLRTIRQLIWRIVKDPENVFLIQMSRIKGEACALPLILPRVFEKEHQALVTGLSDDQRLQLLTKPDLKFKKVPAIVEENPGLREELIVRAKRAKGMQATARELMEIEGLPNEVMAKISQIATGKKEELTDEEAINIILLSDVVSRYSPAIQTLQSDIVNKTATVPQLSRQFLDLTDKVDTRTLISKLSLYLGEEGMRSQNNTQVFAHLYQRLQQMKDGKMFVQGQLLELKNLFGLLRSIICLNRSQYDPDIWDKCLYILKPLDSEALVKQNLAIVLKMALQAQRNLLIRHVASTRSLVEIFCIQNVHEFILDKKLKLADENLPVYEKHLMKTVVIPSLHARVVSDETKKGVLQLFNNANVPLTKLDTPIHCIGASYGRLIDSILIQNLARFLKQNTRELLDRYHHHFFDIFYEQGVLEPGIPVSRANFAQWIGAKQITSRIDTHGYFSSDLEFYHDPQITAQVILGNGQSIFPADYTNEQFARDFLDARRNLITLVERLKKIDEKHKEGPNPVACILDYIKGNTYNIRSVQFRKHIEKTFLYREISEMVQTSLNELRFELESESVNKKVILKVPHRFESLLILANTFTIDIGSMELKVRLHALPLKEIDEKRGVSHQFSANLDAQTQNAESPERQALIQAIRIVGELYKAIQHFCKLSGFIVMDRLISTHLAEIEKKQVPPDELRSKLNDDQKLVIGNIRNANLGKLFRFDQTRKSGDGDGIDSQTFAQMLEAIMYWKSVSLDFERRRRTVSRVITMLNRFSKTLKKGTEWKTYFRMVAEFNKIISKPIDAFDIKMLKTLSSLSYKMNRLVSKREYKDNAIGILYAEWKRKYPKETKRIYFYTPFIEADASSKSNTLQEIRKVAGLARMMKSKKAIIMLPEASKKNQIKQMVDIVSFLRYQTESLYYVETSALDEDSVNEVSKTFHPSLFFQIEKL